MRYSAYSAEIIAIIVTLCLFFTTLAKVSDTNNPKNAIKENYEKSYIKGNCVYFITDSNKTIKVQGKEIKIEKDKDGSKSK